MGTIRSYFTKSCPHYEPDYEAVL